MDRLIYEVLKWGIAGIYFFLLMAFIVIYEHEIKKFLERRENANKKQD